MEEYDVLVVGAGPSGSAATKKCISGGLKTLLIDKKKLPRRKICSGIITNVAQNYVFENFGPIPEHAYSKPYISRGMAMYFPSTGTIFADVDCYSLYIWRDKFDYFLAESSGAKLEDETHFIDLEQKDDVVEVILKFKLKERKVRTKYIVGADGGRSSVILRFAPDVYEGLPWGYACQKYFEGTIDADDRYLYWIMEKGFGPFPWLNLKDDQIIIGCGNSFGSKPSERFQQFIKYLEKNMGLKIKQELATEGCIGTGMTQLNRFFPGRGRVLMTGDAMGVQHQGGEAISCGLVCGGYAGESIISNLKTGADALETYKMLIKPEIITALDQWNPFRLKNTAGSGCYRQPSVFHEYSVPQKIKLFTELASFVKSEFSGSIADGMLPAMIKNTMRREFLGNYKIGIVD